MPSSDLPTDHPLAALRASIDEVDDHIVALLRRRAHLANEVSEAKRGSGLPVYSPTREREILAATTAIVAVSMASQFFGLFAFLFPAYADRLE